MQASRSEEDSYLFLDDLCGGEGGRHFLDVWKRDLRLPSTDWQSQLLLHQMLPPGAAVQFQKHFHGSG